MAFSQKLAAFFGFGEEPEPELEDDAVAQTAGAHSPRIALADAPAADFDSEQTRRIFDQVVAIFNEALPTFLAKSVDPEKQKAAIYNALDQGTKDYLASVISSAQAHCQAQWATERDKLTAEAEALKKRAEELEEKNSQTQEKRMSADRQKRALSERVRDLEMQVQKLEAEKEQYEIESKCMVNKTKAAAVLEKELEELRQENNELRAARLNGDATLNAGMQQSASTTNTEEYEALKSELETAKAEANTAKSELEAAKSELVAAKTELEAAKAQAGELKKQLEDTQIELELTKESIPEDPGITREELEEVEQKVACFEEVKQKLDARIESLKESLKAAQKQVKTLQKANVDALRAHAAEVKQLREELAVAIHAATDTQIEEVPKSALVNELISDTDWLVATPPNTPSMRPPEDKEFGYQPPQRKPHQPRNDAQMSLFD